MRVAGDCAAATRFGCCRKEVSGEALARAAGDPGLLARVASLRDTVGDGVTGRSVGPVVSARPVAFFCAEFGVHQSLPVYSGGFGGLAGDLLKEASDRALPLVAVGLMYRKVLPELRVEELKAAAAEVLGAVHRGVCAVRAAALQGSRCRVR